MPSDPAPWWRSGVTYEIYIRSFMDANGDGLGDLAGIGQRLDYLVALGIDAIWITPFYPSPMADHGYDVANYLDVDARFGTLRDIDALIADIHARNLRVIIDVVPNHTSIDHPWFRAAIADRNAPERAYYVFRDPGPDGGPPNDWQSIFGGPAWELDEVSGQYYLHSFASEQPDLDWHHPAVRDAFDDIIRFWLDRGVDGIRIDVAHAIGKDLDATHAPPHPGKTTAEMPGWDQPATHAIYRHWRALADTYAGDRVFVGEVGIVDTERLVAYVRPDELHLAFNFPIIESPFDARELRAIITEQLKAHDAVGATCTWVLGNHDQVRVATRYGGGDLGRQRALAAFVLLLALPGAPYIYQGEELGLEEVDVAPEHREDPAYFRTGGAFVGRDGCRTPMPWSANAPGHDFTHGGYPWLPFAPDATIRNATEQPDGFLEHYQRALHTRRALLTTLPDTITWLEMPNGVLAFTRGPLCCVCNTNDTDVTISLATEYKCAFSAPGNADITGTTLQLGATTTAWLTQS